MKQDMFMTYADMRHLQNMRHTTNNRPRDVRHDGEPKTQAGNETETFLSQQKHGNVAHRNSTHYIAFANPPHAFHMLHATQDTIHHHAQAHAPTRKLKLILNITRQKIPVVKKKNPYRTTLEIDIDVLLINPPPPPPNLYC